MTPKMSLKSATTEHRSDEVQLFEVDEVRRPTSGFQPVAMVTMTGFRSA